MLHGIQIILLAFIALLVVRTIRRFRDKTITQTSFIGWMLLWILGAGVIISPESTNRIADVVGVGRGVDVVVYVALVLIFYLLFRVHNRTITLEREITKLVRALALQEEDENNDRK